MKTPEQVSLDRIANALEELSKTMAQLAQTIEKQNYILRTMVISQSKSDR